MQLTTACKHAISVSLDAISACSSDTCTSAAHAGQDQDLPASQPAVHAPHMLQYNPRTDTTVIPGAQW
jgi:hypothetical protein